jgi:hypothetical protein
VRTVTRTGASRRRLAALIACLLWLVGFEALPWLHVALHDDLAPHVHAADGTIVRVSFTGEATHRHADGTVHRGPADHAAHHRRTPNTGYKLDHGAGSLAHHGVAVVPTAAPRHEPLPVVRRPIVLAVVAAIPPVSLPVPLATARGPPAVRGSSV